MEPEILVLEGISLLSGVFRLQLRNFLDHAAGLAARTD